MPHFLALLEHCDDIGEALDFLESDSHNFDSRLIFPDLDIGGASAYKVWSRALVASAEQVDDLLVVDLEVRRFN